MWVFVDDCYIKTLRLATILNTVYVTGNTVMIYNYDLLCYHANYRLFMIATNKKCYINSWLKVNVYSFNIPTTVSIQNILAILIWLIWVYGNSLIHFILHWVLKVTSKAPTRIWTVVLVWYSRRHHLTRWRLVLLHHIDG